MAAVRFTILSELLSPTNHGDSNGAFHAMHQSPWRDKQHKQRLTDDVKGCQRHGQYLMSRLSKTQRFRAFDLTPDLQNRSQMCGEPDLRGPCH